MTYIAVDVGGTQLRAALYPESGIVPVKQNIIATRGQGRPEERLLDTIASVWPETGKVNRIAMGVAGPVNPAEGVVYYAPNIDGWDMLHIVKLVEGRFHTPAVVGNDANLAALGEWKYGAGVGHHDLIYLTISTGIGGGVISGDRMLVGGRGIGAELGHITVLPDGPMCGCGHRGHLEAISSGTGIANYVVSQLEQGRKSILARSPERPTARTIADAARQGDELAQEAFNIAGEFLGRAIADFLHIFAPTIVILGGGVTHAGNLLMHPVWKSLRESVITPEYLKGFELTTAKLGDQVGLIGALALARG